MKIINSAQAASLALMLCWACDGGAQDTVRPLTGHVIPRTDTLRVEQGAALDKTLQAIEVRKGNQLVALIDPTEAPKMIRVIDGEPLQSRPAVTPNAGLGKIWAYGPILFILAIFLSGFFRELIGRFPAAIVTGGGVAILAWLFAGAVWIALVAGAGGVGGAGGGFSSSGDFGGGGASGGW